MEDAKIVELYWRRSERAISETARKYGTYCRAIAGNICGSGEDAEECVNDTWFRAWNLMPDKRPQKLASFLGRITRNFAIDRHRTQTRKKRGGGETLLALEELSECVPSGVDIEKELEDAELGALIREFVLSLGETERKVFVARYWFLAPVREIAERLACSESKVKSMLHRMRGRLEKRIEEGGYR